MFQDEEFLIFEELSRMYDIDPATEISEADLGQVVAKSLAYNSLLDNLATLLIPYYLGHFSEDPQIETNYPAIIEYIA